ncbi:MAG: hypothetical protein GEV03_26415 [Streptosporangiales bacterium]|nr:hypothetical protein [Streptosporangiales bacterium]
MELYGPQFAFVAQLHLPDVDILIETTGKGARLALYDGQSWAGAATDPRPDGMRPVEQHGPRRLWDLVEHAHAWWHEQGRPGWWRFGLTVTPRANTVWFGDPDSGHTWNLPSRDEPRPAR